MININSIEGDDQRFIELVTTVVESSVVAYSPETVRIVRIDNWFGERWRGFGGKLCGAIGISPFRLVIPPFVPSRVVAEIHLKKQDCGYSLFFENDPLHKHISSAENLRRTFDLHCPETIAIWFSSQSALNRRGSIMVYSAIGKSQTASWYVEALEQIGWDPTVANGITKSGFTEMITLAPMAN